MGLSDKKSHNLPLLFHIRHQKLYGRAVQVTHQHLTCVLNSLLVCFYIIQHILSPLFIQGSYSENQSIICWDTLLKLKQLQTFTPNSCLVQPQSDRWATEQLPSEGCVHLHASPGVIIREGLGLISLSLSKLVSLKATNNRSTLMWMWTNYFGVKGLQLHM